MITSTNFRQLSTLNLTKIPKTTPPKSGKQKWTSSSAGDYEFTNCPAYVPVTHGNQQADTTSSQPCTTTGPCTGDKDGVEEYEVVIVSPIK